MIIPDVNILIYAHNQSAREHTKAKKWLEDAINSGIAILLPWIVISSFIRITTSPNILSNPLTTYASISRIKNLLSYSNVNIISPSEKHLEILENFTTSIDIEGRNFTDAQIASLAIEYNATLCSNDTDFLKYPGLKLENPLKK